MMRRGRTQYFFSSSVANYYRLYSTTFSKKFLRPSTVDPDTTGSVDVQGIVSFVRQPQSYTSKYGVQGHFFKIALHDARATTQVTFWSQASQLSKDLRVGDFISISNVTLKTVNPYFKALNDVDTSYELHTTAKTYVDKKEKFSDEYNSYAKILTTTLTPSSKIVPDTADKLNIQGTIAFISPRTFEKFGRQIVITKCLIKDATDTLQLVIWDQPDFHEIFKRGDVVCLQNVTAQTCKPEFPPLPDSTKSFEIHVTSNSLISKLDSSAAIPLDDETTPLDQIKQDKTQLVAVTGTITNIYPLKYFQDQFGKDASVFTIIFTDSTATTQIKVWNQPEILNSIDTGHQISLSGLFVQPLDTNLASKEISTPYELHSRVESSKLTVITQKIDNPKIPLSDFSNDIPNSKISTSGRIRSIQEAKNVISKTGKNLHLFKALLSDGETHAQITFWDLPDLSFTLNDGDFLSLSNVRVAKKTDYSLIDGANTQNELHVDRHTVIVKQPLEKKFGSGVVPIIELHKFDNGDRVSLSGSVESVDFSSYGEKLLLIKDDSCDGEFEIAFQTNLSNSVDINKGDKIVFENVVLHSNLGHEEAELNAVYDDHSSYSKL